MPVAVSVDTEAIAGKHPVAVNAALERAVRSRVACELIQCKMEAFRRVPDAA